ncbi:hypothetical protein J6P11_05135 [bacterium]|nr:hypothetical protein [bacterium]
MLKNKEKNHVFVNKFSDKKKIVINLVLYYGLRFFILAFGIIRIFLINIFLGVTNYGLLNVMMSITPISLFLITGTQQKSFYVLYKYALSNNYEMLNKLINQQMKEMHFYSLLSIIFLLLMMTISYFFVNSAGLPRFVACLLILGNSLELLSLGIVLPYVQ